VETASILVGPILAGLALAASGAGLVLVGAAAVVLAGGVLVLGVRPVHPAPRIAEPAEAGFRHLAAEAFGGFGHLLRERGPRAPLALLGAAAVLWGALDVLIVVLAFDLLGIGEAGVGYLNAAIGAGGLLGSAVSVALIGRARLAGPFAAGIVLWALPLLLIGLLPGLVAALLLLAAAGMGRILMDVAGRTLLQRVAPERLLTRVFGVLEGLNTASLALGSIIAPALILLAGERGAFVLAGCALLVAVALLYRQLHAHDATGIARPRELALLRGQAMFAPLGPATLEQLAANLVPAHAHAESVVIRQGEHGDHFYIVVAGRLVVEVDGQPVRELGPSASFGEIALLRDVPRTATVRAVDDTELVALGRRPFLEAVTGQPASLGAAEDVVRHHLDPSPPRVAARPAVPEEIDARP
jgi:hypothetical protein